MDIKHYAFLAFLAVGQVVFIGCNEPYDTKAERDVLAVKIDQLLEDIDNVGA